MMQWSRRDVLAAAFLGAGTMLMGRAGAANPVKRTPNIIFILADDLGYGDLGCYGQKDILTPSLDGMAAEGLRFTDFYAGSTVCAPSRCSLMTGLHTGHAYIRGNALLPLREEDTTVAELLKRAGYATGLVGKWGLGEPGTSGVPNRKGFDEFYGYLNQVHAHNYYPEYLWRNETRVRLEGNKESRPGVSSVRNEYTPDLFAKEALDFITRHRDHPFFLYLSPTIPHANNERQAAESNGMEVPSDAPYGGKFWPQEQKNKAAMITRLDQMVGEVLRRVKELGLDEHTLVFFTSDNGPHKEGGDPGFLKSSGPLRGIKRDLYEGGIRVPMLLRWPGVIPAASISPLPCAFWDILPTLTDLAGAETPAGLDGIFLGALLRGKEEEQQRHEYLYWEFHEGGFKQAVRMGNWKAVRPKSRAPVELYDLAEDLGEEHDLAPGHRDRVAQAEALFLSARTESKEWKTP